jgi:hypothetical protein
MIKRLLILSLPLLVLLAPLPTQGQSSGGRAGLIVKFGDGSIRTSCVAFEGESISSLELLQRSGLEVIAQAAGNNAAVCKIGSDGCDFPAEPCFCKFGSGQEGLYWAFWRLGADGWQYSNQGAGIRTIRNGEVDGWGWGNGNVQSGVQPPPIPFEQICPVAQPAPEPTAPPTPRPTLAPTERPRPTARPQPTLAPTARPTVAPTARAQPTLAPTPAIAASAPSVTPELAASATPSAIATLQPSATPTATSAPTATATPTVAPATASPTPAPPSVVATTIVVETTRSATPAASYIIFGVMLLGLLAAIGAIIWRRRQ